MVFLAAQQSVLSEMRREETFYFVYRIAAAASVEPTSVVGGVYGFMGEWIWLNVNTFLSCMMKDLVHVRWPRWWSRFVYGVKGGSEPIVDF
jgi:hypothetical protein